MPSRTSGGLVSCVFIPGLEPSRGLAGGEVASSELEGWSWAPRVGEAQDRTRREKPRSDWLWSILLRDVAVRAWVSVCVAVAGVNGPLDGVSGGWRSGTRATPSWPNPGGEHGRASATDANWARR